MGPVMQLRGIQCRAIW